MKKRSPLAVFMLSLVTFGIYDLYWLVVTKKELNQKTSIKTPTIWLLFAPVVLMIVALVVVVLLSDPKSFEATSNSLNATSTTSAAALNIAMVIVYFLSLLVILPITFFWFFKFSKAVEQYTNGKMSTGVTFLLLWLLHLLGVAIVQDTFNDMIDAGTVPSQAAPPQSPAAPTPPDASAAS